MLATLLRRWRRTPLPSAAGPTPRPVQVSHAAAPPAAAHALEPRLLFAAGTVATPFPNVDVAPLADNQSEPAIAVDPTNPARLFAASNTEVGDLGLTAAVSTDGGATWANRDIADGTDGFAGGCCDPTAAFDSYGNLFFAYLAGTDDVPVLLSTDGGKTFTFDMAFGRDLDQPTITTGPGSVWLTYAKGNSVYVVGAPVAGLGQVGDWGEPVKLKGSGGGSFGDVAVGPDGQVAVTYQKDAGGRGPVNVHVDPDGVAGPAPFGTAVRATTTGVKQFEFVPAQDERGIDSEAALAYDTSDGPCRGRLYLAYTDAPSKVRPDTDIFLRYSDDDGGSWSAPARVNDDAGTNSQFLPRLAVDPADGQFVLSWYDARDDVGDATAGVSPDGDPIPDDPNDQVTVYAARGQSTPAGLLISANARVAAGYSGAAEAENMIELGDYTGLTIAAGVAHPAWADNSDAAGGNHDGAGKEFDVYTAAVPLAALPAADRAFVGGLPARATSDAPSPSVPVVALVAKSGPLLVTGKKPFQFAVTIADPDGVDLAALPTAIRVTGPNGFDAEATLRKAKTKKGVTTATYQIAGPTPAATAGGTGTWTAAANGTYAIGVADGGVKDLLGNAVAAGSLGVLVVAAK
jgi:hypothetical protein